MRCEQKHAMNTYATRLRMKSYACGYANLLPARNKKKIQEKLRELYDFFLSAGNETYDDSVCVR